MKIVTALLCMLLALSAYGQTQDTPGQDTPAELLCFRFDKALVDSGYMHNGQALRHLHELLTDSSVAARIDSISILSFASPDGNRTYNERLAHRRATAVKGYLVWKYPHLDQYRIHPRPQGENWQELRRLIASDSNVPDREEVLRVIDRNKDSEQCKALLKKLNGGIPYHYIYTHLLRYLRNASVCMVWVRPESRAELPAPVRPNGDNPNRNGLDGNGLNGDNSNRNGLETDSAATSTVPYLTENDILPFYPQGNPTNLQGNPATAPCRRPLFAVKTNLLFDAALMPNVEIEVPIGKSNRWSVNGEWIFPWWLFDGDKYCMQVLMGGLEGRYWLGSRKNRQEKKVLTGHFLGLYAGGGKYDLQWDNNGYQGEFFIAAGISYGYAHPIGRHLRLEYNIGIGLLRTDYRHYHARDNYRTLLWQENGKYTWFGPTKAKISLVWLLSRKTKKGGTR